MNEPESSNTNVTTKDKAFFLLGGFCGWIWIFASLAAIYFLVMALFFDGSWSKVIWAFGISIVAKALTRAFRV